MKNTSESSKKRSETLKGRIFTEEWKRKISEAKKAKNLLTQEQKDNLSEKALAWHKENKEKFQQRMKEVNSSKPSPLKGRKMSNDMKKKLSESHKGKRHSLETRLKMRESHKNISEETRSKLSQASKRRVYVPGEFNHSEETKRKMSVSQHLRYKKLKETNEGLGAIPNRFKHGVHYSNKAITGSVNWTASYELKYLKLLDTNDFVIKYDKATKHIPPIPYDYEGNTHLYFPDFIVYYLDGTRDIIEVKPSSLLEDPKVVEKAKSAKALYGDSYKFVTEKYLFDNNPIVIKLKETLDEELDKAAEEIKKRFIEMLKKNGKG